MSVQVRDKLFRLGEKTKNKPVKEIAIILGAANKHSYKTTTINPATPQDMKDHKRQKCTMTELFPGIRKTIYLT